MQHIIEWPGGEWMTRKEAVRALGVKAALFDRLLSLGIIPPPEGDTDKSLCWRWSDIYAAAQLWPRLLKLLLPGEGQPPRRPPKKNAAEGPQRPDQGGSGPAAGIGG